MSDEAWFIVRNTPGVLVLLFSWGPAQTIPTLARRNYGLSWVTRANAKSTRVELNVEEGDYVPIIDGLSLGLSGQIEEIDRDHDKLKVVIENVWP